MSEATRAFAPALQLDARHKAQLLRALSYLGLGALAFITLIPFFWMLSTSFKPARGLFVMPPKWIPDPLVLDHYIIIWQKTHLARGLLNSTFIALSTTVGEIATSTLAGFAFARMRIPAKGLLFSLLLLTMMIPGVVTLIPTFILFGELEWIDTFYPVILPYLLGTPFALSSAASSSPACRASWRTRPRSMAPASSRSTARSSCPRPGPWSPRSSCWVTCTAGMTSSGR